VRAVPRLCELYPGICLTTEEKVRRNLGFQGKRKIFPVFVHNAGKMFAKVELELHTFSTTTLDEVKL
jgi:hypothetical protein